MRRMRHLKPREIHGCQLALDASIPTSLYDATSGGSLVAANGAVARWEDQSGNARHVTQGTLANRPLRRVAAQSGLDAIEFDGADDALTNSATYMHGSSAVCIFCVAIRDSTADTTTRRMAGVMDGAFTINMLLVISGLVNASVRRITSDAGGNSAELAASSPSVYACRADYTNSLANIVKNGKQQNSNWGATTGVTGSNLTMRIGATDSATQGWDGKIAEVAAYAVYVSDYATKRLHSAQQRKWRING